MAPLRLRSSGFSHPAQKEQETAGSPGRRAHRPTNRWYCANRDVLRSCNHVPGHRIHDMPCCSLELRDIQGFALRRNCHAVASALVGLVPKLLATDSVDGDHAIQGCNVDPSSRCACRDPLDVFWTLTIWNV